MTSDAWEDLAVRLVYCTYCNKAHAVKPDEKACAPGAWLDPGAVSYFPRGQHVDCVSQIGAYGGRVSVHYVKPYGRKRWIRVVTVDGQRVRGLRERLWMLRMRLRDRGGMWRGQSYGCVEARGGGDIAPALCQIVGVSQTLIGWEPGPAESEWWSMCWLAREAEPDELQSLGVDCEVWTRTEPSEPWEVLGVVNALLLDGWPRGTVFSLHSLPEPVR